jgi:hypothetical protein
MIERRAETEDRSPCLVGLGWITLLILYLLQVCLFVSFLAIHLDNRAYAAWFLWFVPAFVLIFVFFRGNEQSYADEDETIWGVWIIWGSYIFAYVITVGMIFATVAHKLTNDDNLGRVANPPTTARDLSILPKACPVLVYICRAEYLRWH